MNTIFETAQAVRAGTASAEETVRECLESVEASDGKLRAFLSLDRDRALDRARLVDAARARGDDLGPLAGVPIALKDVLCTAFGTTTCGSRILKAFHSQYNAHAVEQLESAGAILVGKTNLDEFAMGSSTEHSAYFTTRNPWNETRVAGGSSGGSAAAVAARMVPGALGSDTGGSVRQPASFCGVVGLKPTYGRVSRYGLVAFGSSLDQIGPIATDVRDVALLLGVIAGRDERDSTSVDRPVPDYLAALGQNGRRHDPLKKLRIGIITADPRSEEYFGQGLSAAVREAVQAAIDRMEQEGATTIPVHLPHMKYAVACYYIIASAEASSNLTRYDGVHYGYRTPHPKDLIDLYASSRGEGFGAEVKRRIMLGTYALSSGYYEAYYLKALKVRTLIKRDFEDAFAAVGTTKQVDVIASPVAPTTAFTIGEKSEDPLAMYLSDIYTLSANLAGICAISIPCGFDGDGLPIGLQLMGPAFGEEQLLAVAHQYQLVTDHHTKRPPS